MVRQEGNRLVIEEGLTRVYIECWGESSLRVRMTAEPEMDSRALPPGTYSVPMRRSSSSVFSRIWL